MKNVNFIFKKIPMFIRYNCINLCVCVKICFVPILRSKDDFIYILYHGRTNYVMWGDVNLLFIIKTQDYTY